MEIKKSIKAIYKLPNIKHVFFIVTCHDDLSNSSHMSLENKKRKEYFEHTLQSKDRIDPIKTQRWTPKLVSEYDFLMAIEQHSSKAKEAPSQSFHNPENMELLSINLSKPLESSVDYTFSTPKVLSVVPIEDIIEVYI